MWIYHKPWRSRGHTFWRMPNPSRMSCATSLHPSLEIQCLWCDRCGIKPEEISGSVWPVCSVFVCLSHFIISDKSISVRCLWCDLVSLVRCLSVFRGPYASIIIGHIFTKISFYHGTLYYELAGKFSYGTRMYTEPFLPRAKCESQLVTVTFPWEHG